MLVTGTYDRLGRHVRRAHEGSGAGVVGEVPDGDAVGVGVVVEVAPGVGVGVLVATGARTADVGVTVTPPGSPPGGAADVVTVGSPGSPGSPGAVVGSPVSTLVDTAGAVAAGAVAAAASGRECSGLSPVGSAVMIAAATAVTASVTARDRAPWAR